MESKTQKGKKDKNNPKNEDDKNTKKSTTRKSTMSVSTTVESVKMMDMSLDSQLNNQLDDLIRESGPSRSSSSHNGPRIRGCDKEDVERIFQRLDSEVKLEKMQRSGKLMPLSKIQIAEAMVACKKSQNQLPASVEKDPSDTK